MPVETPFEKAGVMPTSIGDGGMMADALPVFPASAALGFRSSGVIPSTHVEGSIELVIEKAETVLVRS